MHKQTIFYVDDNAKSRLLLASILREIGFEVIAVGDSMGALDMLEIASFDLVLLDYQMPKMNGAQLARAIKGIFPGIPIVMISGHPSLPQEELLYVDEYCGKGATLDELVFAIHNLISTSHPSGGHPGSSKSDPTSAMETWSSST